MIEFLLNDETVSTPMPGGTTVLDFVRYRKDLKGTKIGCREGDCGACNVLVGELVEGKVRYRSMTSCLTPLSNVDGKHVVTIEGINPADGGLSCVQRAMSDNNGTQCGFCTPGFVVSLTGFLLSGAPRTEDEAVSAIDGNICRCTGYKPIERAAAALCNVGKGEDPVGSGTVPAYFESIPERLLKLSNSRGSATRPGPDEKPVIVGGGTDLYVQRPEELARTNPRNLFDQEPLRGIRLKGGLVELGASATVTDLLESPLMQERFPRLRDHLKLVSSTPIRNMATLAGNFVNASPIGDMTVWFLALDAEVAIERPGAEDGLRMVPLKDLYLGYKKLSLEEGEMISSVRFREGFTHFNFEKVCKRTCLDIASVNTAISLRVEGTVVAEAHVSAGGVAPVPLYLRETSDFLAGREVSAETILEAASVMQGEISPISDVRGSESYKRLLLRQLFFAHFVELFGIDPAALTGRRDSR